MDDLEKLLSLLNTIFNIFGAIFAILASIVTIIYGILNIWSKYVVGEDKAIEFFKPVKNYFEKPIKRYFQELREVKLEKSRSIVPIPNFILNSTRRQPIYYYYLSILLLLITIPLALVLIQTAPPISIPEPETLPPINWYASGGMNVVYLFWMYILFFAIIGAMRSWAQELMVIFSVVTALAVILLVEKYIPLVRDLDDVSLNLFWIRTLILFSLVFFGYQTFNVSRFVPKAAREKLQDTLFGYVLGGVNGYLIAGTILAYYHKAEYPYPRIIAPGTDPGFLELLERMMAEMPPNFISEPGIYFAVILMFAFVFIVYR